MRRRARDERLEGEHAAGEHTAGDGEQGLWTPVRRTGRTPRTLRATVGAVTVAAGALMGWLTAATAAQRTPVLIAAHQLQPGQVLTDGDLRTVEAVAGDSWGALSADRRDTVVGRTVAYPLVAGSPITAQVIGPPAWPPADKAVVAVRVQPGEGPPVQPGQTIGVVVLPDGPDATAAPATPDGAAPDAVVLLGVVAGTEEGGLEQADGSRVVTILVDRRDAPKIAAAALGQGNRIALILLTNG